MTKQEFLNVVSKGGAETLRRVVVLLRRSKTDYCVIGGLAVNAYADPVVSLDLDIVVVADSAAAFLEKAVDQFKIKRLPHSIILSAAKSDLRIQVQTDPRYQEFISRAVRKKVLGQLMKVAALRDVLQGKLWAFADERRRRSKRQKDLADIYRLVETHPHLKRKLPPSLK
jgi:Nucleotidyl transferase AbiEii toxin, Type IV TA system